MKTKIAFFSGISLSIFLFTVGYWTVSEGIEKADNLGTSADAIPTLLFFSAGTLILLATFIFTAPKLIENKRNTLT